MLNRHRPSGVVTGKYWTGAPLVVLAVAAAGAVYQVGEHYIPLIYVEALLSAGMGLFTGFLVAKLSKTTHNRNRTAGAALGFVAGASAVAVSHWVEYLLNGASGMPFLYYLEERAKIGWTVGKAGSSTSGGPTISGVGVYIVWLIEACLIIGFGVAGGIRGATRPYCEACGGWADYNMLTLEVPEPSAETLANVKGAMTTAALLPPAHAMIPPPPPPPPANEKEAKKLAKAPKVVSCMRYSVTSCPACKMFHTVAIEHETVTTRGGKAEKKTAKLHEGVLLTSEDVGRMAELKG